MNENSKKTNALWYPYEDFGTYFRLEEGVLFSCPISSDGSRSDDEVAEIDWDLVDEEDKLRLLAIEQELQSKE